MTMKMTKVRRAAVLLCVALTTGMAFSGCEKENKGGTIRLNTERLSGEGKTYVDGTSVGWVDGDVITFNGTECTVTDGVATGIPTDVPLIAFYPSNISNETNAAATSANVTVPSEYTYSYNGHQILAMPMVGKAAADDETITMKHLCSAMQITINNGFSEGLVLDSIILRRSGLSGTTTVNLSSSDPVPGPGNIDSVALKFTNCTIDISGNLTVQIPVLPVTSGTTWVSVRGHLTSGTHYRYRRSTSIALGRATVHAAPVTMTTPAQGNHMEEIEVSSIPEGALPGVFTINDDGDQVYFSKGNLQATGTTSSSAFGGWTWSFAANQYDYIGNATANTDISGNGTVSVEGTVDLFGWSTSSTYFGINNSTSIDTYSGGVFAEWGATMEGGWRTLTSAEWNYLINTRAESGENSYLKASISVGNTSYNGLILFPDNYDGGIGSYTYNNKTSGFTRVDATHWASMESIGAVFLPAAGSRDDKGINVGYGSYWSSTHHGDELANDVYFDENNVNTTDDYYFRGYGQSVRLVRDI